MSVDSGHTMDDLVEQYDIKVDKGQEPMRLDHFVVNRMEGMSRNKVQVSIKMGAITVNDKTVKPSYKIRPLDDIKIIKAKSGHDEAMVRPENIPLDIVYEDDDVMIINKPAGMVVHPGVGNYSGTLVNGLVHYFQNSELPVKEGNYADRPGLVHRIDKNTTGLMIIAKNDEAMTHLSKQFFDHTIDRKYVALVWGQPDEEAGKIETNIGRHPTQRLQMTTFEYEGDIGRHAITHYRTIRPMYYVSLVECELETGRTHQIRVHMKHLGHPLFNDERYGGNKIIKGTVYSKYKQFVHNAFALIPGHALHARLIGFTHPRTGERMTFEEPLPDYFEELVDKWHKYVDGKKSVS